MKYIGIYVRHDQKNSHSHHHIKNKLVVFLFILIYENKIQYRYNLIWKPQKIRNNKIFTKWYVAVKYSINHMEAMYRLLFQVSKKRQVNNGVGKNDQPVLVFLYKLNQVFHSFSNRTDYTTGKMKVFFQ